MKHLLMRLSLITLPKKLPGQNSSSRKLNGRSSSRNSKKIRKRLAKNTSKNQKNGRTSKKMLTRLAKCSMLFVLIQWDKIDNIPIDRSYSLSELFKISETGGRPSRLKILKKMSWPRWLELRQIKLIRNSMSHKICKN